MSKQYKVLEHFIILTIMYLAVIFATPANQETLTKYHITDGELHFLEAILAIPALLVLGAAFYGYARLKGYSDTIKDGTDGRQIIKLAGGLGVIAYGLVITGIISGILSALEVHHGSLKPAQVIITNYMSIVYLSAALILISSGTHGLIGIVRYRSSLRSIHGLVCSLIIIGVVYSYFVFRNSNSTLWSVYHLPLWLILTTIVIPYIYVWFVGLLASLELFMYTRKLRGIIYKKSWRWVAMGLGLIIILDITLQILSALTSGGNNLSLKGLFFVLLLMYIFIAIGFLLIAMGVKGLKKIEIG